MNKYFIIVPAIIYLLFFYEYTYHLRIEVYTQTMEEVRLPVEKHRGIFYCQEPQMFEHVKTGHHATDWEKNVWEKRVVERKEISDKQFSDIIFQCQISLLG